MIDAIEGFVTEIIVWWLKLFQITDYDHFYMGFTIIVSGLFLLTARFCLQLALMIFAGVVNAIARLVTR